MAPWPVIRERLGPIAPPALICALLALVPFSTCIVKITTGRPCPACGMTRASLRLLRGDVHGSVSLHPLALPSAVALGVALALAVALPPEHPLWGRYVRASLTVAGVAFVAVWVLRMGGLLPMV
jgi:hypothetical protein